MNNSHARLIDGMTATLRSEVLPRLSDDFARGQVFGVINLLNTLRVRGDWAIGYLHDEVAAQRDALARAAEMLAEAGVEGPARPTTPLPEPTVAADLERLRDEGNAAIIAWLRWLWTDPAGLDPALAAGVEAALRESMRAEVKIELAHSSRPMFAEMSQGTEG
ncbi:MAG: hypothetical protein R3E48_04620 [Burkholderiaceae bacterium]